MKKIKPIDPNKFHLAMEEKRNKKRLKRSMRRKIRKFMIFNSGVSNLILSVIVLTLVIMAIGSFGALASNIIASDIVGELQNPMSMDKFGARELNEINTKDMRFQTWLNSIGNRFYFNISEGFILHDSDSMMTETINADGEFEGKKDGFSELQLVFVEITMNDEVLFSTFSDNDDFFVLASDQTLEKFYYASDQDFVNSSGEVIGQVKVVFNPFILIIVTGFLVFLFVIATLLSSFVSMIMSKLMSKSLTSPIGDLQLKMNKLAEGDVESALMTELTVKKPFSEVVELAKSTNIIIEKMRQYTETLEEHRYELTAQNDELEEKSAHLTQMNSELETMNVQMKDILDNVGQGFLRFESDLRIHGGYSKECYDIFSMEISGYKFSELIFKNDGDQSGFVDELLFKLLTDTQANANLFLPLLPDEVIINDKIIEVEYKISKENNTRTSIIVILSDITEKRQLEIQMGKEQNILKMVVKALVNRSMFIEILDSFENFIEDGQLCKWQFNTSKNENKEYILRQLHTFKGNFSQFDVLELTEALHVAETQMLEYVANNQNQYFDVEDLLEAYNKEINIIKEYVGEDYLMKDDFFLVEKNRILEIEKRMQEVLSEQDCRVLLPEIRSLCYRPIKELLKMYPEYTIKMAERLEKTIYQVEIDSDEILVDELKFQDFTKSMVHVFRNAIAHGIETPEERADLGKDIMGKIECSVKVMGDQFEIIVKDDGRGIDLDMIRLKLISEGNQDEVVNQMSDQEIYQCLFDSNFSTTEATTLISGRGIGLSAVKKEVENLKGDIIVTSELGHGTAFKFVLPLKPKSETKDVSSLDFIDKLAVTCNDYLKTYVDEEHFIVAPEIKKGNRIELNQITALVSLKGIINALVMISVNQNLGIELSRSFLLDEKDDQVIEHYTEDVLAEVANIVLGNTLGQLDDSSDFLHIGVPAIISNQGAYVKYTNAEILTFNLIYGTYQWSVHMIQLENSEIEENSLWLE